MDHKTTIIAYTNAIWPLRTGSDYVIEGHAVHFAHPTIVSLPTSLREHSGNNVGESSYIDDLDSQNDTDWQYKLYKFREVAQHSFH